MINYCHALLHMVLLAGLLACADDAGTSDSATSDADSTTGRPTVTVERHYAPPPDQDITTFPELITDADFIGIVRLVNVVPTVVETEPEAYIRAMPGTQYAGALKFTFDVQESYKSTVHTSPSRVVALVGSMNDVWTREEAQATADRMLRERNTQWDDRDAIVFLGASSLDFPDTASNDLYYMGFVDYTFGYGDVYSLASERIRLLLPEARQTGTGTRSAERRFLTGLPTAATGSSNTSTTEHPAIALSDLKSQINTINGLLQANPSADYLWCLSRKYKREREEIEFAKEGKVLDRSYTFEETIGSGLPADTVVVDDTWHNDFGGGMVSQTRFLGQDANLFEIGEATRTFTEPVYATLTNLLATKPSREFTRSVKPLETTRPLPAGVYNLTWRYKMGSYILCDPENFVDHTLIVTGTSPAGTLHEAFFDPVTVGTAIAADATNGVLKPTAFTDGNSASATLQRIAYEPPSTGSGQAGTVKLKLSPHTGLANHVLDFIGLDGTVILSLDADDATVDAANNTLSWPVAHQPWKNGDKLMLRIHNGPVTPVPAPAAPTGLTATAGAGSVTLAWDNPSDSTITGYEYQMRWAGVGWQTWKAISGSGSSTTSHTVTGLTGGTEYRFHLRAVNANGSGTAAPNADPWYVAATPSVPPPAAPTGLTATAGRESVKLSWNNPSDSTITRYEYQARWTGVGWQSWKAIPNSDSSTTSHLVTGLTGGTEYRFHVRAVNASGAGPQAPNAPPWYVSATPGKR